MTVRLPAKLPYLTLAYKTPSLKTVANASEAYALEVAAGLLDGGNGARLPARLVRGSRVAAEAGAGYDLYARMANVFALEGTPATGKTLAELETALLEEVRNLREEPAANDELERVKAQVLAQNVFQRDSMFYQAMQLGMAETVGLGWRTVDEYVARINAVTAAEVQAVARKYLTEDALNVAILEPLPLPEGVSIPDETQKTGGAHVR